MNVGLSKVDPDFSLTKELISWFTNIRDFILQWEFQSTKTWPMLLSTAEQLPLIGKLHNSGYDVPTVLIPQWLSSPSSAERTFRGTQRKPCNAIARSDITSKAAMGHPRERLLAKCETKVSMLSGQRRGAFAGRGHLPRLNKRPSPALLDLIFDQDSARYQSRRRGRKQPSRNMGRTRTS